MELAGGRRRGSRLEFYGQLADYDTRLLDRRRAERRIPGTRRAAVNYVNAPLIAAERGIEVAEEKQRRSRDFTNLIAVSADDVRVAGTTIGRDDRHWLVSAFGFELEMELAPLLVFLQYDDSRA